MEVKEAIEFINWAKDSFYVSTANKEATLRFFEEGDKVISLIERGKKFEAMWEELYAEYGMCPIRKNDEEGYMSNILYKILEELQQKYFPKIKDDRDCPKDFTEKVMEIITKVKNEKKT